MDGAYPKARLTGPATWASLPVEFWEKGWQGMFVDPVCRLDGALYELQRAGFDGGVAKPFSHGGANGILVD